LVNRVQANRPFEPKVVPGKAKQLHAVDTYLNVQFKDAAEQVVGDVDAKFAELFVSLGIGLTKKVKID
jgi:hypothetical protein